MHRLPTRAPSARDGELLGSHDGRGMRIAVAAARFNDRITRRLLDGALETLEVHHVGRDNCVVCWVPGAFELPLVARELARSGGFDAVVCLGAVIRGETSHYDFVAGECAAGLQRVQLDSGLPIVFGVLTTENLDQALERSGGALGNKGGEAVLTAIEMVHVVRAIAAAPSPARSRRDSIRGLADDGAQAAEPSENAALVAERAGPQA